MFEWLIIFAIFKLATYYQVLCKMKLKFETIIGRFDCTIKVYLKKEEELILVKYWQNENDSQHLCLMCQAIPMKYLKTYVRSSTQ